MKMYGFFRSGTSHRTRILLNLKKIDFELIPVSLMKNENKNAEFKQINPQGFVPVIEINDQLLIQSPAIMEWIEETYPDVPMLPQDAFGRARVRAIAALIGCDIHPINNKRILDYLRGTLKLDEAQVLAWCQHWINEGFSALETLLNQDQMRGDFCYGNSVTFADAYLVAQVESANRFKVDMNQYPIINTIYNTCLGLDAFKAALPSQQPDAV
ncbi:MAG: maleylacetoacetate isomerase [Candidatus Acinetobacter avistercoris]|uniref:maleylacetoacetate isomerase n=1 Tax=Acinetobacter sp. KS-LM10 TaxID=3120518 RepID=UPI001F9C235A|nr:maleylacetoacetate isomerase [Candidatus Acinetobacter avistercoris]